MGIFEWFKAREAVGEQQLSTEKSRIMKALLKGKIITIKDQSWLRTSHLHARIGELRIEGMPINKGKLSYFNGRQTVNIRTYYVKPEFRDYCLARWKCKKRKASLEV